MISYSDIHKRVDQFLRTREGLNSPKKKQSYAWFVGELTGIFCRIAHENNLSTVDVLQYLNLVQNHKITNIKDDGKLNDIADLIDNSITEHPLYNLTEHALMYYKPGNVQVGPGEFFMCFYDSLSVFGIDNQAGYDIFVDLTSTEMKKLGTNKTNPPMFDGYAQSDKVDRLLVVKPVSDAKNPRLRSKYVCITFSKTDWREVFYHGGNPGDEDRPLKLVNQA